MLHLIIMLIINYLIIIVNCNNAVFTNVMQLLQSDWLYYTILHYTILHYTILYYTVLCCAVLCCAVLCCAVLYTSNSIVNKQTKCICLTFCSQQPNNILVFNEVVRLSSQLVASNSLHRNFQLII